jgi:hypothetical protein
MPLDQRSPKGIEFLGGVADAGAVLAPELVARGDEAARRPEQHVGRAGAEDAPHILATRADRQVVEAVGVEVAGALSTWQATRRAR